MEHLTKRFPRPAAQEFTAVDGLTFEVTRGEVLALLGPNGAGKTTTVRMLAAIFGPSEGRAWIDDLDVVTEAQQVRHQVGLLTEFPSLYDRMAPLPYLDYFGELQGVSRHDRRTRAEALLRRFDLWSLRDRQLGTFSKGMRQKMALCRALIHQPAVLFLDEPTSALDPGAAKGVRDYIRELSQQGCTVVVCTHNLAEAESLAQRIAIIQHGRIVAMGSLAELRRRLLGAPVYELRVAEAEAVRAHLDGLVHVSAWGTDWIRYKVDDPVQTNPALLRRLVSAGAAVISLGEVSRSLEDVYLELVGAEEPGHAS
ncbi:MAG: ABC transporter ATP-binding protein [Chloroflexi bacterium]|nr:ABC transporter ATP-binding protein [Chloroflexota bacterium]MBU1749375.1 ABC transporter ATP-binding protein [Chloroflexota bacterium]